MEDSEELASTLEQIKASLSSIDFRLGCLVRLAWLAILGQSLLWLLSL